MRQLRFSYQCDLDLWPFDLWVDACRGSAIHMLIAQAVFLLQRGNTQRDTKSQKPLSTPSSSLALHRWIYLLSVDGAARAVEGQLTDNNVQSILEHSEPASCPVVVDTRANERRLTAVIPTHNSHIIATYIIHTDTRRWILTNNH